MESLINLNRVNEFITNNTHLDENGNKVHTPVNYRWTHGATDLHMGDGIVVYSMIQHMRAKNCVCIGSGGGYIPRIITQARLDLHQQGIFEGNDNLSWGDIGATYLVDACNGVGGPNDLLDENSFFRYAFHPRLIKSTSEEAYYNFFVIQDIKIDVFNRHLAQIISSFFYLEDLDITCFYYLKKNAEI